MVTCKFGAKLGIFWGIRKFLCKKSYFAKYNY